MNAFKTEWKVLQNQFDAYEKFSLVIKLVAVSVCLLAIEFNVSLLLGGLLLLTLWFQDAIWKTFQSRIEQRLVVVETQIEKIEQNEACDELPMQFNRQFLLQRTGIVGLISEYFSQALRPTIAFPHVVLVLVFMIA